MTEQARPSDSLGAILERSLSDLSPSEALVARFLLTGGAAREDYSLRELASLSGASQAAVVRMCKALGFPGFREFRLAWVREAGMRRADSASTPELFADVFGALRETEQLILSGLAEATEAIASADRVFLYGIGGSALIAEVAAKSLMIAGCFAVAYSGDSGGLEALRHLEGPSVVMVISHRGENPILETVLTRSKEHGAVRIVLTSEPESTLASMADILLITGGAMEPSSRNVVSSQARVVQVAAVHALIASIVSRTKVDESAS